MRSFAMLVLILWLGAAPVRADDLQTFLESTLTTAREAHGLPGVAALVQIDGKIAAEGAVGARAEGHPEPVTTGDLWHIGSDTKAFTATMIARLAERGTLQFEDTLATLFPDVTMHANYRNVTLAQLLSHMAGLPKLTDEKELGPFLVAIKGATDVPAQRAALVRAYLTKAPLLPPGTKFEYSNLGFIVAGAAAERRTGKSWEDLVRSEIFAPLGIINAGFGAPGSASRIDQPRGHLDEAGKLVPLDPNRPDADNPASLGPAGTIHISLRDWMRFAQDQLDGIHGRGKLLKVESYRRLHTPSAANGIYAMGWGSKLGADGSPVVLTHSGSNGSWFADIRIYPKREIIILAATNAGTEGAGQAVADIRKALQTRLRALD
jgi:CubicO group peptidase (beta-lactamase class C family)